MKDITKMKRGELKELLIQQLITIRNLIQWSEDNKVPGLFGSLIIESEYLQNRNLINPNDYSHKIMKRDNYLYDIQDSQKLISELEGLKTDYEKGHFNQLEATTDEKESNLNQTDIAENDKGNSIQKENEKSNQNQNKRGGRRVGAGRKGFGETRKVSVTLPSETWAIIEEICEKGNLKQSKVLRDIIDRGIKHP
ncbi:CopG family transcriptional regulator [Bacillus wiedmannii]|uniref:CopG family transcriptional regulator n=1 Tax=Bacillus wiedmannii TaxID=1890302 RepID=UPI00211D4BDE|nr:CopG family transcriptional regulator [Bacillus wiedmannii]